MIHRLFFPFVSLFLLTSCLGNRGMDNRNLVSVSFVNTGPVKHEHLRANLRGGAMPIRLGALEGYSEEVVIANLPLTGGLRVQVEGITGARSWKLGPAYVGEPARKDADEKYNLRITLTPGQGSGLRAELEPIGVLRARLEATGNQS